MKFFIYTPCDVALKQDMIPASIMEVAIMVCFEIFQEIDSSLANMKMGPDVYFLEFI